MQNQPLYFSVMNELAKSIETGRYVTGDRLPTEAELCKIYSVSRVTIRQALKLLQEKGYVARRQGSGTYVTYYHTYAAVKHSARIVPFSEEMAEAGMAFSARVVSFGLVEASRELAEELNLEVGEKVSVFERVMMGDGRPITLERGHMPVRTFPDLSVSVLQGSKTAYIEKQRGIVIGCNHTTVDAILPDDRICELLAVDSGTPLLKMTQILFDEEGLPVEKTILTFNPRVYEPSFIKVR